MRTVKEVKVKDYILDGKKIYIQSMLNKRSDDIEGSVDQAVELEKAGCDIVRAAIPNMEAIKLIPAIKDKVIFLLWLTYTLTISWLLPQLMQE